MARSHYVGHASFLIKTEEFQLLIDPFITGNPLAVDTIDAFTNVDYIFVTHGHGDHLGDTVEIHKRTKATVITNFEISQYLGNKGVACHAMHIGGSFAFPFGQVKMTPALHGSGITDENGNVIPGGSPCGFLIEIQGCKIYHAGDTGLSVEMQLLKDEHIHVALLPIGGNFVMNVKDAAKAANIIQPSLVVPMHYNTFDLIKANPEELAPLITGDTEVRILQPGDELLINP